MTKVEKRHTKILNILESVPLSTISELSESLDVSTETIRKDLNILSEEGAIVRTHGGVALTQNNNQNQPFDFRMNINSESKRSVGKAAARLIKPSDVILLESSTTSLALVRELCQNKELLNSVTLITSSFKIAALLDETFENDSFRLFFLGGWTSFEQHSTYGQYTLENLAKLNINKAFISGAALSEKLELTGYTDEDVAFQKYALKHADEIILMLEKGKYPKTAVLTVDNILQVDSIVTDVNFTKEVRNQLSEKKINLIQSEE